MLKRVLVCGDRLWQDKKAIHDRLFRLPMGTVVAHGGARGADTLAGDCAQELNLPVEVFHAEWEKYGRAAGPLRNQRMLDSQPDLVIAFHHDLSKSKGTANCVAEARRRGIPVEVHG